MTKPGPTPSLALAIAAAIAATVAFSPARASAQADAKTEARKHYDRGLALANEGSYAGAIAEFDRAYQLSPHYAVLYNLGQANLALGRAVDAVESLERYLSEGGRHVPEARRKQVEADIAHQELRIATVTFTADQPGATVRIGDTDIGKTPLGAPVRLDVGLYHIVATLDGFRPWEQNLSLVGEERRTVDVHFVPSPGTSAPVAVVAAALPPARSGPAAPLSPPPPPTTPPPATTTTVTVAGPPGAGGLTAAGDPAATVMMSTPGAATTKTRGHGRVTASLTLAGLGVVAGGVATYLYFWNKHRFDQWADIDRKLAMNPNAANYAEAQSHNNDFARSINRTGIATVTIALGSAALITTGVVLYLTAPKTVEGAPPAAAPAAPAGGVAIGLGSIAWSRAF